MKKLKYLLLAITLCGLVAGCSKKEEEPVETEPPKPQYMSVQVVEFNTYGDEGVEYCVQGNEAVQSYSDVQAIILPDKEYFDTISIDYIQGVSLNQYDVAYWNGLEDSTKTEIVDGAFQTDTTAYCFYHTEKNSYLLVKGDISHKSDVERIARRFSN